MLQKTLNEKNDYYKTLGTMAGMFNSMHVIDLVNDNVIEFSASKEVKEFVNHQHGAVNMMAQVMSALTIDDYKERALEFTNLTTLAERMKNKKYITNQLKGYNIGWFLATFITMESDEEGRPTKVVYTTQSINEEKKQEEKLIFKSRTDELTGLLNRRAYEEDLNNKGIIETDNFVYMSLDVNGLKIVNDTFGHLAGDELLQGASQCMKRSLAPYGKLYRTGGDEFIAILFCDNEKLKEVLTDFEETIADWSGELVKSLTISYGYVSKEEKKQKTVKELASIADKRMYEAKAAHYKKTGVDRRGHQDAHRALCKLFTKILKINISEDSYQIINAEEEEINDKSLPENISSWLVNFGKSGKVHPEDLEEYLAKTDINYMKEFFEANKSSLKIIYRRKYGKSYKRVMMEIIPANDYSKENQNLYVYVKQIED